MDRLGLFTASAAEGIFFYLYETWSFFVPLINGIRRSLKVLEPKSIQFSLSSTHTFLLKDKLQSRLSRGGVSSPAYDSLILFHFS